MTIIYTRDEIDVLLAARDEKIASLDARVSKLEAAPPGPVDPPVPPPPPPVSDVDAILFQRDGAHLLPPLVRPSQATWPVRAWQAADDNGKLFRLHGSVLLPGYGNFAKRATLVEMEWPQAQPWFQAFIGMVNGQSAHREPNAAVRLTNHGVWGNYGGADYRLLDETPASGWAASYKADFAGNENRPGDIRGAGKDVAGPTEFRPPFDGSYNIHGAVGKGRFQVPDAAGCRGLLVAVTAGLTPWDPAQPIDYDAANLSLGIGCDACPTSDDPIGNWFLPQTYIPGVGLSRMMRVTREPQRFVFCTLRESELRANPPPAAVMAL